MILSLVLILFWKYLFDLSVAVAAASLSYDLAIVNLDCCASNVKFTLNSG